MIGCFRRIAVMLIWAVFIMGCTKGTSPQVAVRDSSARARDEAVADGKPSALQASKDAKAASISLPEGTRAVAFHVPGMT